MAMFGTYDKRSLLSALLLVWLAFLAYQIVRNLGGRTPAPPNVSFFAPIGAKVDRGHQMEQLFSTALYGDFKPARNMSNPFYSIPFVAPPPPDPPTTRQVNLLYQGYFVSSQGEKKAYVLVDSQLVIGGMGSKVVAQYFMSGISPSALVLKDGAGKELKVNFNAKTQVVVPIN
jgi:hypothetical protein